MFYLRCNFFGNGTRTHRCSTNLISHNSLSDFDIGMLTTTSNDSFDSQQGQLFKFITTFKPQTPYSFFHNTKWSNTYHIWTNVPKKELILCKCHKLTTQPAKSILWKAFLHFLLVFFYGGCICFSGVMWRLLVLHTSAMYEDVFEQDMSKSELSSTQCL